MLSPIASTANKKRAGINRCSVKASRALSGMIPLIIQHGKGSKHFKATPENLWIVSHHCGHSYRVCDL